MQIPKQFHKIKELVEAGDLAGLEAEFANLTAAQSRAVVRRRPRGARKGSMLYRAVWHDAGEAVVRLLLAHGADPNAGVPPDFKSSRDRQRPIHLALHDIGMLAALLEAGADPDARTECGMTPLMSAAFGNYVESVRLLLEAGADAAAKMPRYQGGANVFNYAAYSSNPELVALLAAHPGAPNIDHREKMTGISTGLHRAVYSKDLKLAEAYLKAGADPNLVCDSGNPRWEPRSTLLHKAAVQGHLGIISLLIKYGAEIDKPDKYGNTPLHEAAGRDGDKVKVVRRLLKHRADPNVRDKYGQTPLHYAVLRENAKIAGLLLENGADPDIRDHQGRPAAAAGSGLPERNYGRMRDYLS